MAVAFHQLDKAVHDEYCCTFAALLLHDEGLEITGDKLKKLIEASGNKVESFWPGLYAKALSGRNINDVLSGGGAAPAPAAAGGAAAGGAAPAGGAPAKKAEAPKKEEKKEDEDMGGPIGLFGDDDF